MKPGPGTKLLAVMLAVGGAFAAHGVTVWNEDSDGDFSNNGLAPTALVVTPGVNSVLGATGNNGQGVDRDYFTFAVPAGSSLTSLILAGSTTVSGGASFIALQAGPQITVSPSGAGVENLLGFAHYSYEHVGTDILPAIGFGAGHPSGMYSVWVQETGGPTSYGLDFVVTADASGASTRQIPLAPSAPLLAMLIVFGLRLLHKERMRSLAMVIADRDRLLPSPNRRTGIFSFGTSCQLAFTM